MTSQYASEAGHWYTKQGEPKYEIVGANGKLRPTTKRDARKLDLVPSVSGIIKCASADALTRWKIREALRIAYENPPGDNMWVEAWIDWIYEKREEEGRKVRDLGSKIHGCIECHLRGKDYDQTYHSHVMGAVDAIGGWCGLDGLGIEKSFAHPLGFGGKSDLHKRAEPFANFVGDFKSKDFGPEWQPATYDSHWMQLGAYREGLGMPNARGAIIYISTTHPNLVRLVEVSQDELEKGWRMFCALLTYWQEKNGFST